MRSVLFFLMFLLFTAGVTAQNNHPLSCRFKHYFLIGDMDSWLALVDSLQEQQLSKVENDVLLQAQYGLMGYFLSQNRKERAAQQYQYFEKNLNSVLKIFPQNPEYLAMKAASYGFEIGMSPIKAPFLNSKHLQSINRALQNRNNCAFPLIEQGNSLFFRPPIVGGNKEKAVEYYEQAVQILEKQQSCNWLYYSISSWLGQVYTKMGEPEKSFAMYKKLLAIEPEFEYVKDELLPQLQNGEYVDMGAKLENNLLK